MKPSRVLHICNSSTKKAKIKASEATLEFTGSSDYTVEVLPQKKKKKFKAGNVAQLAECWPSMHKALDLMTRNA